MSIKPAVCVDLDGVLADDSAGWQGPEVIGPPMPGAKEFMEELSETAYVIVFTCRTKEVENLSGVDLSSYTKDRMRSVIAAWMDKHGIPYDEVYTGQGKPLAAAYIDDRAINCRPLKCGKLSFTHALARVRTHIQELRGP